MRNSDLRFDVRGRLPWLGDWLSTLGMLCGLVLALLFSSPARAACSSWLDQAWLNEYQHGTASFLEVYSTKNTFPASWQNWTITVYQKNSNATYTINNSTSFACTKTGNKTWVTRDVSGGLPGTEALVVLRDASGNPVDAFAFDNNSAPPDSWKSNSDNFYTGLVTECSSLASRLSTQAGQINTSTNKYLANMLYAADQGNKDYSRTPDGGSNSAGNAWYETSQTGAGTTYTTCTSNNANLTKTIDLTEVAPGSTVNYTVVIANPSASTAITVDGTHTLTVTDPLPAGLVFVSATSSVAGDTITKPSVGATSGTVTWNPITIPASGRTVLTITMTVPTTATVGTTYSNTASASGSALSQAQSDSVTFTVVAPTTRSFLIQTNRQTSCKNSATADTPIITITAKDQINGTGNTITGYTGTVTLGTSSPTNSATWSKVSGSANGTLTLTSSGATYSFAAADNGVASFYLTDTKAETIDLTATDLVTYSPSVMSGIFSAITYQNTCSSTTPLVSIAGASIFEGHSGSQVLNFPVTLSFAAASNVTVTYATTNGTASSGSDYASTSGTLTITAGSTTANIPVTIYGDTLYEGNETFTVTIASPTNAILGVATATGTIVEDDSPSIRALYIMDEQTWTNNVASVLDSSGSSRHATVKGVGATTTYSGGSAAYTSSGQSTCGYGNLSSGAYLELPSALTAIPSSITAGFTLTGWVKASSLPSGDIRLIGNPDSTAGWALIISNGKPGFTKTGVSFATPDGGTAPSATTIVASSSLSSGQWVFVAVAVNNTAKTIVIYSYNNSSTTYTNRMTTTYTGTWAVPAAGSTYAGGDLNNNINLTGSLDEVKIYDGPLSQTEIETIRTEKRSCATNVDHYELSLPTSGLSCTTATVTVKACTDTASPCTTSTSVNNQTAALATSAGTLASTTVTFDSSGIATTTLSHTTAANGTDVSVTLSGETISANNSRKCCPDGANCTVANSCTINFKTAGFVFASAANGTEATLPTQTAGTESATYYLRAVQTNTSTKACEAALVSSGSVNLAVQCLNPTTCSSGGPSCGSGSGYLCLTPYNGATAQTAVPLATNPDTAVSSYTNVTLYFDANGNAPLKFNYLDVGQIKLAASKAASGTLLAALSGSSNAFVVKPSGFTVTGIKRTSDNFANPAATGAAGTAFVKAGDSFSATISAVSSGGAVTPNFGAETTAEGVALTHALVQPASGAVGSLGGTSAIAGASFQSSTRGVATVTDLTMSEVGIISLTPAVADGNYLGVGNVTGTTSANIGRFYPHHFALVQGSSTSACGSFSYFGQDGFTTPFTITAQNASNTATTNYAGDGSSSSWAKLPLTTWGAAPAAAATPGYGFAVGTWTPSAPAGASLAASTTTPTATNGNTWVAGTTTVSAKHQISRPTNPAAPTTATITALPVDSDGVTATAATAAGSAVLRFGVLRLENAYGSELLQIRVPMKALYCNAVSGSNCTDWRTNTLDSCTSVPSSALGLGNRNPAGVGSSVSSVTSLSNGSGTIVLAKPTAAGSIDLAASISGSATGTLTATTACLASWSNGPNVTTGAGLTYLTGQWCGTAFDKNPIARLKFGSPKAPFIYMRERY